MAFRRRFIVGLLWRFALTLLTGFGFVYTLWVPGLGAARLLAGMILAATLASLWRYVQWTNMELARFVSAIRFGDFSQNFTHSQQGSGFGEMGEALEQGIRKLREERHRLSDANRFYEAVLDDAPTPLLTVDSEGRVELALSRDGAEARLAVSPGPEEGIALEVARRLASLQGGELAGATLVLPVVA